MILDWFTAHEQYLIKEPWQYKYISVFIDTTCALLLIVIFLFVILIEKYIGHKHTKEGSGQCHDLSLPIHRFFCYF